MPVSQESMVAGRRGKLGVPGAALDCTAPASTVPSEAGHGCRCRQHLQPVQLPLRQMALTIQATEERPFPVGWDLCRSSLGRCLNFGVCVL